MAENGLYPFSTTLGITAAWVLPTFFPVFSMARSLALAAVFVAPFFRIQANGQPIAIRASLTTLVPWFLYLVVHGLLKKLAHSLR